MAKKATRIKIKLKCTKCKELNYTTTKNPKNTTDKIEIEKFCKHCRAKTKHTESKIERGKTA